MRKETATRSTRATAFKNMAIITLAGLPIEPAAVLFITAVHWGVIA